MLLFCSVQISRERIDKHIWVVKEKGGSSRVYISTHPRLGDRPLTTVSTRQYDYALDEATDL